ncbi:hypothetical protein [Haloferax sp. Q22]|uniref:hypothetical protein n=1 Tax=Haloferax sp. (strain Q22) TaxID=1526048 RepID=UPI000737B724|nr:hypothetical protein [Haloferax sp. Q22]
MMEDIEVPHVYTDSDQLSGVTKEYVCWLDLMGIQNTMATSVETSAIDILNLHVAVDEAMDRDEVTHYPIMDGVYLTSKSKDSMLELLQDVFAKLAKDNIENRKPQYVYIPRASLAFGPIVHGENLDDGVNEEFITGSDYAESLLLGLPMIQAVQNEPKAPPFGIYIDESARAFAPSGQEPIERTWYDWFIFLKDDIDELLYNTLEEYYDWCLENSHRINYPKEDIEKHQTKAEQYLLG